MLIRACDVDVFAGIASGCADPHGMPELRKCVCDYLRAARAVRCEPEQVIITAGTQQAVDIVIRFMQGPDR